MLAIRLQRTGRTGHAQFRLVVQDARFSPTSGKVVAQLGSYNPHNKTVVIDKEKAAYYLEHGAQPSDRAISILKKEGVKLPKWVADPLKKEGKLKNPEKLRKNRPAGAEAPAPKDDAAAEVAEAEASAEPAPTTEDTPAEDAA
jgi:small subunit ribosomal protein S16